MPRDLKPKPDPKPEPDDPDDFKGTIFDPRNLEVPDQDMAPITFIERQGLTTEYNQFLTKIENYKTTIDDHIKGDKQISSRSTRQNFLQ